MIELALKRYQIIKIVLSTLTLHIKWLDSHSHSEMQVNGKVVTFRLDHYEFEVVEGG